MNENNILDLEDRGEADEVTGTKLIFLIKNTGYATERYKRI